MKKLFTLSLAFAMCSAGFSQDNIKVSESNEQINGSSNNCLVVTVYADKNEVESGWKSVMKSWKGGSFSSKGGEMQIDDAKIKDMGDNTFDAFAKVVEQEEGVCQLVVAVDLGGAYLSSRDHADQFKVMQEIVYEFAVGTTKDAIGAVLKEEEKKLEELQKEEEDLAKEKEDLEKEIEDMKKKIEENEKRIDEIGEETEEKKEEIGAQEKVVEEIEQKQKGVK